MKKERFNNESYADVIEAVKRYVYLSNFYDDVRLEKISYTGLYFISYRYEK